MQRFVAGLIADVASLTARVAELEEKVRTNSSNSSKAPSKDGPSATSPRGDQSKGKSKRERGAQSGHEGEGRTLLSVEQVDRVEQLRPPTTCPCGGVICTEGARPVRHGVWELHVMRPHVTEYQVVSGRCSGCGEWAAGELPPEARGGMLGPRAVAVIAALTGKFRLSNRSVEEVL